ncbi:MAG: permease, partial [Actinomycetia bacterium]|nr:permease [Actinomycetes bacterium]
WITRQVPRVHENDGSRWTVFTEAARHDFLQAASYLVIGAAAAAALHILVPPWVFEHIAGQLLLGIALMALLAVILALCSEADAFVAASLSMLPLLPRLVFLVVGPAIDIKLFAMQVGMFGRAFAVRFAPATFFVAIIMATGVGLLLLGNR